ncbi:MAG TPA: BMP family ABC transporter substrate-binding protein [Lachnospiraceae bacterium]|nr:BMP family ABC transporter substrate-binding protein [Lachnospiraceae bacterium]
MKKKLIGMIMSAAMVLSLAACGGAAPEAPADTAAAAADAAPADSEAPAADAAADTGSRAAAAEDMKVAMVTDYGDVTDQSFNQSTYEACKAFCDAGGFEFTYYKPEGDSTAERVAMIDKAVADGYNVVLLPGFAFAEAIIEATPMYPDIKFISLDMTESDLAGAAGTDTYSEPNVFVASYQEELVGYMAGFAAVKMGYTRLGFLGGMAVPGVMRYGYGFVQGADAAAAEDGADVTVNYAYGNQFYGDADITAAMDTWYSGGTEVVFACGGAIYTSVAEAAAKVDGKVIGVDVDQAAAIDGQYGEGMTITSAMKGLGATVETLLSAIRDGKWDDYAGKVLSLGIVDGENPEKNYVQLPLNSTIWTDSFTVDDYKAIVAGMADGSITVSNDISAGQPSAETVKINFQGNIK